MRERVYGIVKCDPGEIEVVPLTEDLVMQLEKEAALALSGRCDLENMQTSCCHRRMRVLRDAVASDAARTFERCDARSRRHRVGARAGRALWGAWALAACARATPLLLSHDVPRWPLHVSPVRRGAFRRHGVGRLLLDAVKRIAARIYLVVARRRQIDRVRPHLEKRADRLRHMYSQHMRFRTVCESSWNAHVPGDLTSKKNAIV